MICYNINISGKVHKTGLRYFLKQKASELNITGSVTYLNDNTVSVLAIGEKSDIDDFVKHCKTGNPGSIIQEINKEQFPLQTFDSFDVVDTTKVINMNINV